MYKLIVLSMVLAVASAGLIGGHGLATISVAHAPVAVAHHVAVKGATSYQNSNSLSVHPVPVTVHHAPAVVHHAPAVVHAVHAAPAIVAAPIYSHGISLGHGYLH